MVCEREPDSPYDPAHGRIHVVREGDWIHAEGTTLGADNGVAIAAMLAVAEDGRAAHGPLDLLMTVDEERGLAGAAALDAALLGGDLLLNLDSEEDATLTVGCAGGVDTVVRLDAPRTPADGRRLRVVASGARGGHSGGDIALGRANAIAALARALRAAPELRIVSLDGGASRNAIPRDATRRRGRGRARPGGDRRRGRGDRRRLPRHRPRAPDRGRAGRRRGRRRLVGGRQRAHPRPDRGDPRRPARHERGVPGRRRDELVAGPRPDGRDARSRCTRCRAARTTPRCPRSRTRSPPSRGSRAPRSRPATTTRAGDPTRTRRCSPPRARSTPSCSARGRT